MFEARDDAALFVLNWLSHISDYQRYKNCSNGLVKWMPAILHWSFSDAWRTPALIFNLPKVLFCFFRYLSSKYFYAFCIYRANKSEQRFQKWSGFIDLLPNNLARVAHCVVWHLNELFLRALNDHACRGVAHAFACLLLLFLSTHCRTNVFIAQGVYIRSINES